MRCRRTYWPSPTLAVCSWASTSICLSVCLVGVTFHSTTSCTRPRGTWHELKAKECEGNSTKVTLFCLGLKVNVRALRWNGTVIITAPATRKLQNPHTFSRPNPFQWKARAKFCCIVFKSCLDFALFMSGSTHMCTVCVRQGVVFVALVQSVIKIDPFFFLLPVM